MEPHEEGFSEGIKFKLGYEREGRLSMKSEEGKEGRKRQRILGKK